MRLVPIDHHEYFTAQEVWVNFWREHPPIPDFEEYLHGSEYRTEKGIRKTYVTDVAAGKIRQLNGPHSYAMLKAYAAILKEAS